MMEILPINMKKLEFGCRDRTVFLEVLEFSDCSDFDVKINQKYNHVERSSTR